MLAACDQGRKDPPNTSVRVANAAPSFNSIDFRREQSTLSQNAATLNFQGTAEFDWDTGQYDFNIDVATLPRTTFSQDLREDTRYAFVLTEVGGLIEPVVLEYPPLDSNATGAQALALHAAGGSAPLSVYIEPPGTALAAATPRATLAFGQALPAQSLTAGEYEISLTESGNPANVLLASSAFTLPAAASAILVIVDGSGVGPSPLAVILLGGAGAVLTDKNAPSELRAINAATDMAPRDFVLNDDFAAPLFSAVPFAAETAYATTPVGDNTVNVTPVANPGVLELTQTLAMAANTRYTLLVTGDAGALTHVLISDDTRRIAGQAKLRMFNTASQFSAVDFFIVPTGTDIATTGPAASLGPSGVSTPFTVPPDTYDLVLRETGTTNVLAGPQSFTLAGSGIYSILSVNGPDTASATVAFLDDF
jgi:hypothetical protein